MWSRNESYGLADRFISRMIMPAYPFQQVEDGFNDFSPSVWVQGERNELSLLLKTEVDQFNYWVGYNPLPIYKVREIPIRESNFWNTAFTVSEAYLQKLGREGKEFLENVTVTYNGDSATVEIITDQLPNDESIGLFYTVQDGAITQGNNLYKLGNLDVRYSIDRYIITTHKSAFVKPSLQLELDSFINGDPDKRKKLSKTDSTNFVETIDVFRVYHDDTVKVELLYIDTTTNLISTLNCDAYITDSYQGEFKLSYNTLGLWSNVVSLRVYYQAGYPLTSSNLMFESFESIILRRAKALLPNSVKEVAYRISTNYYNDTKQIFDYPNGMLYVNPLGDRVIDFYTWQIYWNYHNPFYGVAKSAK